MLYLVLGLIIGIAIGFFSGFALRGWAIGKLRQKWKKDVCEKLGVPEKEYDRFINKISLDSAEEFVGILRARGEKQKSESMNVDPKEKNIIEIYFEELYDWFSNPLGSNQER